MPQGNPPRSNVNCSEALGGDVLGGEGRRRKQTSKSEYLENLENLQQKVVFWVAKKESDKRQKRWRDVRRICIKSCVLDG